jgi:hypothetical protein
MRLECSQRGRICLDLLMLRHASKLSDRIGHSWSGVGAGDARGTFFIHGTFPQAFRKRYYKYLYWSFDLSTTIPQPRADLPTSYQERQARNLFSLGCQMMSNPLRNTVLKRQNNGPTQTREPPESQSTPTLFLR